MPAVRPGRPTEAPGGVCFVGNLPTTQAVPESLVAASSDFYVSVQMAWLSFTSSYNVNCVCPPHMYLLKFNPNVLVLGDGAFGGA